MKKKMILAGALIALMTVGAFAQTYNAESDFTVTKTATAVTITKYVGKQNISAVNIPPKIQNLPVTTIAGGAFTPNGNITSVTIPNSVTSIQATAFYVLANLKSVTFLGPIPSRGLADKAFDGNLQGVFYATDKNNGTPGTYSKSGATWTLTPAAASAPAQNEGTTSDGFDWIRTDDGNGIAIFGYKGTATALRIPDNVNNLPVVMIEPGAFKGKTNLTSVTFPTSLVEIQGGAFEGCTALTSISLPASLTTIGMGVFRNCTALTTVTIPASITNITFYGNDAFRGATKVNAASQTALQKVGYTGRF